MIVDIDRIPVELTPEQRELWDSGHKRKVRKQIRQERLDVQYTDDEIESMEKAPSFDEVVGDYDA